MKQHIVRALAIGLMVAGGGAGFAEARTPTEPTACTSLSINMRVGASDAATSGSVTALQTFLAGSGYFDASFLGTGHFGPVTYRSVVRFQASQSLPQTGYVGPLTRAAIQKLTCGAATTPVTLYSVSPSSGAIGVTVDVTGFGFTKTNTVLMDGNVIARDVPITSSIAVACTTDPSCHGGIHQTIEVTIPSALAPYCAPGMACAQYMRQVTPGTYSITVMNENGTSSALSFTVTGTQN